MSIDTSKFKRLLESIGGNVKPLVTEEVTNSIVKIQKNFGGNPDANITYEVLEVIRGRKPAYQRERELISEYQPTLNTF